MIKKILNNIFINELKDSINYDNYVFIVQNKCSDIFVAILI